MQLFCNMRTILLLHNALLVTAQLYPNFTSIDPKLKATAIFSHSFFNCQVNELVSNLFVNQETRTKSPGWNATAQGNLVASSSHFSFDSYHYPTFSSYFNLFALAPLCQSGGHTVFRLKQAHSIEYRSKRRRVVWVIKRSLFVLTKSQTLVHGGFHVTKPFWHG